MLSWTSSGVLVAVGCVLLADTVHDVLAATAPPAEQMVLDHNLGASTSETALPVSEPQEIEKSFLPVTLLGTFAADAPALSRATLHDRETDETLVVGIGDEIERKANVERIERGRVVLRENGALRELALTGDAHVATHAIPASQAALLVPPRDSAQGPNGDSEGGELQLRIAQTLQSALFDQGRLLPKMDNDRLVGLEVGAVTTGSLFEQLGLERGDLITEFNGIPLSSYHRIPEVLREIQGADTYRVAGHRADGTEQVWELVRRD